MPIPQFKVENFGESWIDFSLPFECEIHHCFPRATPSANKFVVLTHYTEPRQLKWSCDNVRKYHHLFDLILSNEEELFDLPNVRKSLFGGSWVTEVPDKKEFGVSFLYSAGSTGGGVDKEEIFNGYSDRRILWSRKEEIQIPKLFYTSSKTPPTKILDLNPYPFESKNKLFDTMFSVVIENDYQINYFTEKIIDAFCTFTIPIYIGCPNIGDYFDKNGIISCPSINELLSTINSLSQSIYWNKILSLHNNYEISKKFIDPTQKMRLTILKASLEI